MMKILRLLLTVRQTVFVAWKLLWDPKVPGALKLLLPVLAMIYLISPFDLLPFLPFDDVVIVGMMLKFFVELATPFSTDVDLWDESDLGNESGSGVAGSPEDVITTTWQVAEEE